MIQINQELKKNKTLFSIDYFYSLLFGMLGSMIIFLAAYHFYNKSPQIATVNITALVNDFIKTESKQNKPQDVLTKEVKQFGITLEKTLKEVARDQHLLLMPSEAVIAGSIDYTPLIKNKMKLSVHDQG